MTKDIEVKEIPLCLLCNNKGILLYENLKDKLFSIPFSWTLLQCPKCALVWLNPSPSPTDIPKLYENYFTHTPIQHTSTFLIRLKEFIQNAVLVDSLGYDEISKNSSKKWFRKILIQIGLIREYGELSVMKLNAHQKGKLLDIGCGNGQFLSRMQSLGWEVTGVEIDEQAVLVAREHFGLKNIYKGEVESVGFLDNTFDAITMEHVIEHLRNPINTLKECYRILKPHGRLVILTPNINSLSHRLFKDSWRGLDIPRHLFIFSPHNLQRCINSVGFNILLTQTPSRLSKFCWTSSYLIKRDGIISGTSLKNKKYPFMLWLSGLLFWLIEYFLCKFKEVGEEILLIATKET